MNLDLFFSALRARFGMFATVLASTLLAAILVSLLLPKSYNATASLLVDANKDEQSLSTALVPPRERLGYMQTQMDIITSERVARKAVQDLRLADNPATREAFEAEAQGVGSIEGWLVEHLLKWLKVETSQSNVIQVSFASADPQFSALVANAFAKAYIDTMLELRVEPTRHAATWFDVQLKSLRANLEAAQVKLTDYHKQQGIISTDERFDVENARLGELSSQLVKAQEQTFDLQTRERQARDLLERGASPGELPDVLANPHVQKLSADLTHGEAKLQELATQYGANHPQYQRQFSENQSLREKVDAEMKKIVSGIYNSLRQSRQREVGLRNALAAQRAQLLEHKENRNELAVLTRDVETAQRTYEAALQRAVVSQVESRASQTNVALLSPAVAPRKPSRPKVVLNIALSLVIGTMLGIGIVILMELFDRRVRSRNDLENELNVPLLAVLNARPSAGSLLLGRSGGAGRALPSPG
ncbi:MAG: chain length determinant protein EpsF [Betaproteobacteria bacterium]|nr:chain length determinant protein EpsF [Betaproteobacteria bacterium]